jgi:uncharacterized RDD family membrane protein YckC
MNQTIVPLSIEGVKESIYAGFGTRLGAYLLDMVILIPYIILYQVIIGISSDALYYIAIPSIIFSLWFYVYLVKKYGGTPGKLIMGIKIIKINGEDISWKASCLRYIVSFMLGLFGSFIFILIASEIDPEKYASLNFWQRNTYISQFEPGLMRISVILNNIWIYSEFLVLLTNDRKRSIHDFIGGTVVIKKIYHDRVKPK